MLVFAPQAYPQFHLRPQRPRAQRESPRERYLRALAAEQAAREEYEAELAELAYNPYATYSGDYFESPFPSRRNRLRSSHGHPESPYVSRRDLVRYLEQEQEEAEALEYLRRQQQAEAARRAAIQARQEEVARRKQHIAEIKRQQYQQYLEQAKAAKAREQEAALQETLAAVFAAYLLEQTQQSKPKPVPAPQKPTVRPTQTQEAKQLKKPSERRQRLNHSFTTIFGTPVGSHVKDYPAEAIKATKVAFKFVPTTETVPEPKAQSPLDKLAAIRSEFVSLTSSFSFPTTLVFDPASPSPKLAFNTINAALHSYEESLMKLLSKLDAVESDGDENIRTTRKEIARLVEAALQGLDAEKEEMWKKQRGETSAVPAPVTGYEISDITPEVSESFADTTSIPIAGPGESTAVLSETPVETVSAPVEQSDTPEPVVGASNPQPAVLSSEASFTSSSRPPHVEPAPAETPDVPTASVVAGIDEAQKQFASQESEPSTSDAPAFLDDLSSTDSAPQILTPPVLNDSAPSSSTDINESTSNPGVAGPEVNLTSSADEVIDYSSDVSDTKSVSSVSSAATQESLEVVDRSSDDEDFEVVD
ncbi:hypothetical protein SISNIDRAFT_527172 [Sistotremastrum niveocremeum HHB9708]|uniref:BAG domain-containing protein n=1 Tax=Sistotremastrum niveocremeum HHB9708 TaxID=1314777 RepID=A0A164Q5K9_9AGAM|nr:hypothetical protein SISNIDRAFT_527172 [Sistotremastrum niveocremeum HHB9708]